MDGLEERDRIRAAGGDPDAINENHLVDE